MYVQQIVKIKIKIKVAASQAILDLNFKIFVGFCISKISLKKFPCERVFSIYFYTSPSLQNGRTDGFTYSIHCDQKMVAHNNVMDLSCVMHCT